jgi:hypothetical protein
MMGNCIRPDNPCERYPNCLNYGKCHSLNNTHFTCDCIKGYNGTRCEFEVDICDKCGNGAKCKTFIQADLIENSTEKNISRVFECICTDYFYGEFCETPKNSYIVLKRVSKTIGIASFVSIGLLYLYIFLMDLTKYVCKVGVKNNKIHNKDIKY